MQMKPQGQLACLGEPGQPSVPASVNQATSKAGFSGQPSGLQKSGIKELMGLGGGDGEALGHLFLITQRAGGRGQSGSGVLATARQVHLAALSQLSGLVLPSNPHLQIPPCHYLLRL